MLDVEVVADGLGFAEGPVALDDGSIAVTSITHAAVYMLARAGVRSVVETGGGPNGMVAGPDGSLLVAQNGGLFGGAPGTAPGIQRIRGDRVDHLVTLEPPAAPNDLCFGPDGWLYFTDTHGSWAGTGPAPIGRLFACRADDTEPIVLFEGFAFMNGLAFDPAGEHLYVVETATRRLWRFPWAPGPRVGAPEEFGRLAEGNPDVIALVATGSLWVATTTDGSVQVFDRNGTFTARHPIGADTMPTNCCFGLVDPSTLYVTAAGTEQLVRLETGTTGAPLFPAP
jgi:gluconolactonase